MRLRLNARAMRLDRPVLLFLVLVNVAALGKARLTSKTFIGAINGGLAAGLLWGSLWRPASYAHFRCAAGAGGDDATPAWLRP